MNRPALVFALGLIASATFAQELNVLREMHVPQATELWQFDGHVNDQEYHDALPFVLFNEMDPDPNGTPPVLTKGYVMRTREALIVGVICPLVDPSHLRANVQPRDEAWGDDFVGITLDLYGDMRNTIFIASNAFGVQIDLRNNNPTIEDESQYDVGYNVTYQTATQIDSSGWSVEMRIPFSSLQFENKDLQRWRIGFFREYYVGPQVHRAVSMNRNFNNPCFDCQFNDFLLIDNIKSSVRRDLLPYVLGGLPFDGATPGSPTGKIGLSAFYGINSQNSVEATLNPDFSTVESDAAQISVNSSTSLFYPERRPFFNEGADLTATTMNYFYSRTIANPSGLVKYLGQGSQLRTFAMTGFDRSSPYLVPGENRDHLGTSGQSFSSVVRLSHPRANGANLGYLSTNRVYLDGGSGHLNAFTLRENLSESWRLNGEYAWSTTAEPNDTSLISSDAVFGTKTVTTDGETFHGLSGFTSLERTTFNSFTKFYYTHIGNQFRADMGFVPLNNRNEFGAEHRFIGRPNGDLVKFYNLSLRARGVITPDGRWKNQRLETEFFSNLAGNLNLGGGLAHSVLEEFEFTTFSHLSGAWQYLQWSPVQNFRLNYFVNAGEFLAYNAATPRIANGVNSGITLNVQLFGKLQMNFNGNYSTLWDKGGSNTLYNGWIWRGVARYNPNRFVQARLIAQWDGFSNRLLLQPLLQYQPSPFTLFYIGSSSLTSAGETAEHQIFAKVQITLAAGKS